jgi:hypothetical protein
MVAGELPYNRESCNVLVIKESGGEMISTPRSSSGENPWESRITARLSANGVMKLTGSMQAAGNQGHYLRSGLIYRKAEEQKDWLRSNALGRYLPQLTLENYTVHHAEENYNQPLTIEFAGTVNNFATVSARRLFFNPNILNQVTRDRVPEDKPRQFPVFYIYSFQDIDSLEIEIPVGYSIEAAPLPQDIQTSFGHYQTSYSLEGSILKYRRMHRLDQNMIPPSLYEEYRAFTKEVSKNDNTLFVFKR